MEKEAGKRAIEMVWGIGAERAAEREEGGVEEGEGLNFCELSAGLRLRKMVDRKRTLQRPNEKNPKKDKHRQNKENTNQAGEAV